MPRFRVLNRLTVCKLVDYCLNCIKEAKGINKKGAVGFIDNLVRDPCFLERHSVDCVVVEGFGCTLLPLFERTGKTKVLCLSKGLIQPCFINVNDALDLIQQLEERKSVLLTKYQTAL